MERYKGTMMSWTLGHLMTGDTEEFDLVLETRMQKLGPLPPSFQGLWDFIFTSLYTFDPSPLLSCFLKY